MEKKQIEKIKDCIDSVYGCDCAYYGVDGFAIAEAIHGEGYRKQEWISVEDDKPKNGLARVIVFVDGYEFEGFPKIDTDRYANGKWVRWGKYVTHWMRSPEPPKKK